jgi:glycogen operon protein
MDEAAWASDQERVLALRRAALREDGSADVTLLMLNPGDEAVPFQLPGPALAWIRELDSATLAPAAPLAEAAVTVAAHSVLLLAAAHVPGDAP